MIKRNKKVTTLGEVVGIMLKAFDSNQEYMDKKFDKVDKRFDKMDERFDKIEKIILDEHNELRAEAEEVIKKFIYEGFNKVDDILYECRKFKYELEPTTEERLNFEDFRGFNTFNDAMYYLKKKLHKIEDKRTEARRDIIFSTKKKGLEQKNSPT